MYQFSGKPHLCWLCWLNFHLFHRSQRTKTAFYRFISIYWSNVYVTDSQWLWQLRTIKARNYNKTNFKKTKWGTTSWEEQQTRFCLRTPLLVWYQYQGIQQALAFFVLYLCKKIWKGEKPFCNSAYRDIHRILSQKSRWWLEQYNQSSQWFYSFVLQKSCQHETNTTSLMPWFALK